MPGIEARSPDPQSNALPLHHCGGNDLGEMTFGQGLDAPLGHRQELLEAFFTVEVMAWTRQMQMTDGWTDRQTDK